VLIHMSTAQSVCKTMGLCDVAMSSDHVGFAINPRVFVIASTTTTGWITPKTHAFWCKEPLPRRLFHQPSLCNFCIREVSLATSEAVNMLKVLGHEISVNGRNFVGTNENYVDFLRSKVPTRLSAELLQFILAENSRIDIEVLVEDVGGILFNGPMHGEAGCVALASMSSDEFGIIYDFINQQKNIRTRLPKLVRGARIDAVHDAKMRDVQAALPGRLRAYLWQILMDFEVDFESRILTHEEYTVNITAIVFGRPLFGETGFFDYGQMSQDEKLLVASFVDEQRLMQDRVKRPLREVLSAKKQHIAIMQHLRARLPRALTSLQCTKNRKTQEANRRKSFREIFLRSTYRKCSSIYF